MKIPVMLILVVLFAVNCSPKVAPTTATNTKEEQTVADKTQTTPSNNTMPLEAKPLNNMSNESLVAHGEVVFKSKCDKCHSLKNPADFTADAWKGILSKMVPRAKLDATEEQMLRAYIAANAKK